MNRPQKRLRKIKNKNYDEDDNYLDFGTLGKGFIILGVLLLFIYIFLCLFTIIVPPESIWDDAFLGVTNIFTSITMPAIILIFIGGFLYLFHLQFVKLAEFAEEVESGEFERKCLKELEDETENNGTKSTD